MRKHRKSITKVLLVTIVLTASMSITSWAMTVEEATAKNPTSYTAGTNSVYGPNLTQEQLNAVAQATADFRTNYITDNMDNDTKIRIAHDFLVNKVSYIEWDQGVAANSAYGALVNGQAACSGYARAFKALCDSMDVSCYYVHANATAMNPAHQWNIVQFSDSAYYHVDVQANDSSEHDVTYKSTIPPMNYKVDDFPAIGITENGLQNRWEVGWQQNETGWWWQNSDGSYPTNTWKWIDGKCYYFGADGYILLNTTTPDGYQVNENGVWIENGVEREQGKAESLDEAFNNAAENLGMEQGEDGLWFFNGNYPTIGWTNTDKKKPSNPLILVRDEEGEDDHFGRYQHFFYDEKGDRYVYKFFDGYFEIDGEFVYTRESAWDIGIHLLNNKGKVIRNRWVHYQCYDEQKEFWIYFDEHGQQLYSTTSPDGYTLDGWGYLTID